MTTTVLQWNCVKFCNVNRCSQSRRCDISQFPALIRPSSRILPFGLVKTLGWHRNNPHRHSPGRLLYAATLEPDCTDTRGATCQRMRESVDKAYQLLNLTPSPSYISVRRACISPHYCLTQSMVSWKPTESHLVRDANPVFSRTRVHKREETCVPSLPLNYGRVYD